MRANRGFAGGAILFAVATALVVALVSWTPSYSTSLLQGDAGSKLEVAQKMERFGRQLESEGVVHAGSMLVREGQELASQAGYNSQYQDYSYPKHPTGVQSAPLLGGTNSVFSQSNGGGNGWAVSRRASALRALYSKRDQSLDGGFLKDTYNSVHSEAPRAAHQRSNILQPTYPNVHAGIGGSNYLGRQEDNSAQSQQEGDYNGRWWSSARAMRRRQGLVLEPENAPAEEEQAAPADTAVVPPPFEHQQVATGKPGMYDGDFAPQYRRNAGGHEEAFKKAGLNYDDYPVDIYKGVPWFTFDPAATHTKEMNQKVFKPKEVTHPYKMESGRNAGNQVMPAGWGTWVEGHQGEDKLRAAGIKVDSWPIDIVKGFPLPSWDKNEFDTDRHVPIAPPRDAREAVEAHRESQRNLENAGVQLNGFPLGDGKKHAYNTVDGLPDTLVEQDPVPKYRKTGIARQEHPFHFLLDENPNGEAHNQEESINNLWQSGELDKKPQWLEDEEQGVEYNPEEPSPFEEE